MKVYIEFISWASQKAGRSWIWLEVLDGTKLRELIEYVLPKVLGHEIAEAFIESIKNGAINVLINGHTVHDFEYVLNDGDRVYILPLAMGG